MVARMLSAWFGLRTPVSRGAYLAGGVLFMGIKFAVERIVFAKWLGRDLGPIGFLSPFFAERARLLDGAPLAATVTMVGIALPFLWIGISMSVRRAFDAGRSPFLGFLFLIPGLNYLLMLGLSVLPTKAAPEPRAAQGAYRPAPEQPTLPVQAPRVGLRAFQAILLSSGVGLTMFGICVNVFHNYGAALFLATPFVMGMVAAVSYKAARDVVPGYRPNTIAVGCGLFGLVVVGIGLLLAAQEGGACIAMAIIPAGALSVLGSLLAITAGSLADMTTARRYAPILALPLAAGAESALQRVPLHEVVTTIEIDAPPEIVWRHVTSFSDLDPPSEWIFRRGIAYPIRARIEGEGAGAVRYCEFSTGTFVEPITRWERPTRLSFDVAEIPEPMIEWSPYNRVDAPHLHGFMRSKQGEFRLVPLAGGRTRLEGSTFYELEIYPELYWKVWSDGIVHSIHHRVLDHIRKLSESDVRP